MIPVCEGFVHCSRNNFALLYHLPGFAVPDQAPQSLYSILPRNRYSLTTEKFSGNTNSSGRGVLPSLEQRYQLATALAEGLLSLLAVNWVHKALNSRNVVLYQSQVSPSRQLDLSAPQLLGFGVARRERPEERTVDLGDRDSSPWRYWMHPELRAEQHRRFEPRFDIYALGVVLFEIGMWQDLHYFTSGCGSAEDFRRRMIHVCAKEMAHRMGEKYKKAVMACLDGDQMWKTALTEEQGHVQEDLDCWKDEIELDGMTLTELFIVNVYSVLKACSQPE